MATIKRPPGVTGLGLLFLFGTRASGLAAISLLNPGGMLEPIWRLNPRARDAFSALGLGAPLLLAAVCALCTTASFGFFFGRQWGYWLGVGMLVLQLAGGLVNGLWGSESRALIGFPIAGLLPWYLSSGRVKTFFRIAVRRAA